MAKKPLPPETTALGSLGELLRRRGVRVGEPAVPAPAPPAAAASPATSPAAGLDLSRAGKVIVRRERKGHGGKTVTVVDGLALPAAQMDTLARALRKALGCGSWVEAGRVVLQGDRPDAAAAWLVRHGARQVRRGN
ncbi:translation initiation factor [bacterium]|nr:translation initiation factor [bacterium]